MQQEQKVVRQERPTTQEKKTIAEYRRTLERYRDDVFKGDAQEMARLNEEIKRLEEFLQ